MDKTWKKRERQIAKFFGAIGRTPLSGGNSKHTRADIIHDQLFVEHKHRVRNAMVKLWYEVKAMANKEGGKIPVVTLSVTGKPGFWVMVHSSDLQAVANIRNNVIKGDK